MPIVNIVFGNANYVVSPSGLKVQPIDLAVLSPSDYQIGEQVVDTSGNPWTLTISTATIDHTSVESVNGCPSLRWIKGTGGGGGTSNATTPVDGSALTDANATINPGTDKAGRYTLAASTLTTNRTLTLGTTGSPIVGQTVEVVRVDNTANTYAVANGGLAGGTLFTFGATPGAKISATFQFDGTNWQFLGSVYAQ